MALSGSKQFCLWSGIDILCRLIVLGSDVLIGGAIHRFCCSSCYRSRERLRLMTLFSEFFIYYSRFPMLRYGLMDGGGIARLLLCLIFGFQSSLILEVLMCLFIILPALTHRKQDYWNSKSHIIPSLTKPPVPQTPYKMFQ